MRITHYDIYDNCFGENIVRRRQMVMQCGDIEALRTKMQRRMLRMLRRPDGKKYKELTVNFIHDERE